MSDDAHQEAEDLISYFGLDDASAAQARQWAEDHLDGVISEAELQSMADYASRPEAGL